MPTWPHQPTASGRVYDSVKSAILGGEYKGGTFLTEGALAERLGVSRTPVREALIRLQVEGLVNLHPKKAALVRSPSVDEIGEAFEARRVLEVFAASRTWTRREDLAPRLQPLVADMRRQCASGNVREFVAADRRFHGLIVSAAGNRIVACFHEGLRDRLAGILVAVLRAAPERMAAATEEHAAMVNALGDGDVDRLLAIVRHHINHAANTVGGPGNANS